MPPFDKILIANRGEIACRVTRTARRMGIRTVAVYSDADARSLHVALADEAFRVGPAEARESYLRADRVIEAGRRSGSAAVHPGYGFLSENAEFAEACGRAGLVFIGPPPEAIRAMGDKAQAKAIAEKAGVASIPGYNGSDQSDAVLAGSAAAIGCPLLVKAVAGGGGKGMRRVDRAEDFPAAVAACRREARASFGDDRVLLEKYLERARHVEVQVFADRRGGCVSLFERDCSPQRRHQKVLEEAPAPGLSVSLRERMSEAARKIAVSVGYVGAGTIEFLLDEDRFYFMEMNTRLQVEHPVTESVTGIDLVEWQIRVAAGDPLPLAQTNLRIHGHAIEARIYAEDPEGGFLPAAGRLTHFAPPAESEHLRVDTGVRSGDDISPYYDPMIAKLIAWDVDRPLALERLRKGLTEFELAGIPTNLPFLLRLARSTDYAESRLDTRMIERNADALLARPFASDDALALASLAVLLDIEQRARFASWSSNERRSPWSVADSWRVNGGETLRFSLLEGERTRGVSVRRTAKAIELELSGKSLRLHRLEQSGARLAFIRDGTAIAGTAIAERGRIEVSLAGERYLFRLDDPLQRDFEGRSHAGGLYAPMPGKIVAVLVEPGARVDEGTPLLVLEAMKMEHTIRAPAAGRVAGVRYATGDAVREGAELIDFEADANS